MLLRLILFLMLCLSVCAGNHATAQNHWMYLPNNNFSKGAQPSDTAYRLEDIYFTDTLNGFAVTLTGRLLRTKDGGISWQVKIDTLLINVPVLRSIELLDDAKYGIAGSLGLGAQFLTTADGGETWQNITHKLTDTTKDIFKNNICGIGHFGNTFYAVGAWGSKTGKFFKSTDKGDTWQTTYLDTNLIKNIVDVVFLSADTGFISGARNQYSVVLKTTDGGVTWSKAFEDATIGGRIWKLQAFTHSIIYGSIEPLFYPDTVSMIRSYDGGNTWSIVGAGSIKSTVVNLGTQGIGFATPAKGWLGGYYDGIFETTDSGKTWNHLNFGYDFNRIFVIDSNHVFAGGHMPYKYGNGVYFPSGIRNQGGKSAEPHTLYPVYPSPTKGPVNIEFDIKNTTNVVLDVVGIDSKQLYHITTAALPKGHYAYNWDGSNAPTGNYLIWLGTNEIPLSQKFVLLK